MVVIAETEVMDPDAGVAILHRGEKYVVRFLKCNSTPTAVVCFATWKPRPSLLGELASERFFWRRGLNTISILAADNDWFQHAEIETALAAIRAATAGYDLIGYGGSMGAYASINFADRLGLRRVIAICPQYSIDERRAPYESRWRAEAALIMASGGFSRDRIDQVSPPVQGWIVYDPTSGDRHHATNIQRRHQLVQVPVWLARHNEMRMLQQCKLLEPMLIEMLGNRFDAADFQRRLRTARRGSAVFWVNLSAVLLDRKHLAGALYAVRQARSLPHPEPAEIDIQEARVGAALGHHEAALALATPWTNDSTWSWAAGPLVSQLQAAEPPASRRVPGKVSPRWGSIRHLMHLAKAGRWRRAPIGD